MRTVKILLLVTVICAGLVTLMTSLAEPKPVYYEMIAFDTPDHPPTVFRNIGTIGPVCVGQDVDPCRQQAKEIFRARDMPFNVDADYALFINTQSKDKEVTVILTLFNKEDREVWSRRASVVSSDTAKAGRNLRNALVWSFATVWTQANWKPGKALKSVPFEVEH